jgi:hypothetical protein
MRIVKYIVIVTRIIASGVLFLRINIWCYHTSRVLTISCVGYLVNVLVYFY